MKLEILHLTPFEVELSNTTKELEELYVDKFIVDLLGIGTGFLNDSHFAHDKGVLHLSLCQQKHGVINDKLLDIFD